MLPVVHFAPLFHKAAPIPRNSTPEDVQALPSVYRQKIKIYRIGKNLIFWHINLADSVFFAQMPSPFMLCEDVQKKKNIW